MKQNVKLLDGVDAHSLFDAIEKVTSSGLLLLDTNLHSVFINQRAKMIFEMKAKDRFTDKNAMDLLGPLFGEFKATNEDFIKKELRISSPLGKSEKVIETLSAPIVCNNKTFGYAICILDITSSREKEKLGLEFVSHVSHEMRTPLTIMMQFADILMEGIGGELNPAQKEYLAILRNNIERLGKIVSLLLDISRFESGKEKLVCEIASIERLIKQVVYMFVHRAREKKIKLYSIASHNFPLVRIDVDKIIQVLVNIIENALKYTPEKGTICVRAKRAGSFVEVSVSDTGTGIPEEDKERVFDKFSQLRLKPGPGAKGIGLGLAMSKQIVNAHGGKIWVDSSPGGGSVFTFTVPVIGRITNLNTYIDECIEFAGIVRKPFTLLKIRASNIDKFKREGDKKKIVRSMSKILRSELRKATDSDPVFVKDSFFVGLPNTNKEQVGILWKRLVPALQAETKLALKPGIASYPEDAKTTEGIIKHCIRGC